VVISSQSAYPRRSARKVLEAELALAAPAMVEPTLVGLGGRREPGRLSLAKNCAQFRTSYRRPIAYRGVTQALIRPSSSNSAAPAAGGKYMRRFSLVAILLGLWITMPISVSAQSFRPVPGLLTSISVGGTSTGAAAVWGINVSGEVFEFDGLLFNQVTGALSQITVDGTAVWGLDSSQNIFQFDPDQQIFTQIQGKLVQIAAHGGSV
jgi:Tectonin domain